MAKKSTEITIIGGGLIGLCLAPILGKLKFKVILVDKQKITQKNTIKEDTRTVAISKGTKLFLEKHGIWRSISSCTQPIKKIRVLNRDSKSNILFKNEKLTSPMGYIIENRLFKKKLIEKISSYKNIEIVENNEIKNISLNSNSISIKTKKNIIIDSKLLVAADGKNSFIKSFYNLPYYNIEYNQAALIFNFEHSKDHRNTAFEIFLPNGPLATLPMKNKGNKLYKSSLIWTEKYSTIKEFVGTNPCYVKEIIQEKIYPYLGSIVKIDTLKTFDLSAHICRKFYNKRIVLVGDAAHSIHPIAGQGWNLGMRDLKHLVEFLLENKKLGLDLGSLEMLKNYNDARFSDVSSMLFITHSLNKIFLSKSKFINNLRSLGFSFINNKRKITNSLINYAMGTNL